MKFFKNILKVFFKKKDTMTLSKKALDLIFYYEVGNKDYYQKFLRHPSWPAAYSGVTIGIGYDLGYNTKEEFYKDWSDHLPAYDMRRLEKAVGKTQQEAENLVSDLSDINISWESALAVFQKTTIPKFIEQTKKAFPESEKLHQDAFGALVSLVFNRGSSMKGSRRTEMRQIRILVPQKDYQGIANQIRLMKRLWEKKGLSGLLKRRDAEAALVESCA